MVSARNAFTVELLPQYVAMLDEERDSFGAGCTTSGTPAPPRPAADAGANDRAGDRAHENGPQGDPWGPFCLVAGVGFEPTTSGL
jgi:hypothetical protein